MQADHPNLFSTTPVRRLSLCLIAAAALLLTAVPYPAFASGNQPPVCLDDFASTPQDTKLSVPLGTLLANDSDPDGDPVRLQSYDYVTYEGGTTDSGHIGGFNYTPPSGFTGMDHLNYTITDRPSGGLTATCQLYITVY